MGRGRDGVLRSCARRHRPLLLLCLACRHKVRSSTIPSCAQHTDSWQPLREDEVTFTLLGNPLELNAALACIPPVRMPLLRSSESLWLTPYARSSSASLSPIPIPSILASCSTATFAAYQPDFANVRCGLPRPPGDCTGASSPSAWLHASTFPPAPRRARLLAAFPQALPPVPQQALPPAPIHRLLPQFLHP